MQQNTLDYDEFDAIFKKGFFPDERGGEADEADESEARESESEAREEQNIRHVLVNDYIMPYFTDYATVKRNKFIAWLVNNCS